MSEQIARELFVAAFVQMLEEAFERSNGIFLDRGTSIFETLATISAEEASRPVSANCGTIAAHVVHMDFYMNLTLRVVRGERPEVDWSEIWRTVGTVSEDEWRESQENLRATYQKIRELANNSPWESQLEIAGAFGLLAHNAYHLGEIRHALCTIRPGD